VRAPTEKIFAPILPRQAEWINVPSLRMDQQRGRPVLVEFWDFCRVNSLQTLPYIKQWYQKYKDDGLQVVGIHCGGFAPSKDLTNIKDAVSRLGIEYPVLVDTEFSVWKQYGSRGWPARFLWNQELTLHSYHYGEGAYSETEAEIRKLLNLPEQTTPSDFFHDGDRPDASLEPQSEDIEGPFNGLYAAGSVWAVLDGSGQIEVNGSPLKVEHPGCYRLVQHDHHTEAELNLTVGPGVTCYATCFLPGIKA